MNQRIVSLFFAVCAITVCDTFVNTAELDAFYLNVKNLALSLDPREYIGGPDVTQSHKYNDAHMDMIGEMTIFYYAKAISNKYVTLSFTSSEQRNYKVKFEIREEVTFLIEYDGYVKNINYARVDGKMMRFYVCFLGKLCPKNALNVKYPLTHFKLESIDIHTLMRIFIKGFFFGMDEHVENPLMGDDDWIKNKFGYLITISDKVPSEEVCYMQYRNGATISFYIYTLFGSEGHKSYTLDRSRKVQIRILSLRFAILMIIIDDTTKKRILYRLLMVAQLPTGVVNLVVNNDHPFGFGIVCHTMHHLKMHSGMF